MTPAEKITKHLLIAVRDSSSYKHGARFVGSFFENRENIELTLFYLMATSAQHPNVAEIWQEGHSVRKSLPKAAQKALDVCNDSLLRAGFTAAQLHKVVRAKQASIAQDIVYEGRKGLYDAIVLGKRSASFLEDLLHGNIGHEILEKHHHVPIWFCRDPEAGRKHVLLCLDGSDAGANVADHVGYMLRNEDSHGVTLCHVNKGKNVDIEKTFTAAANILTSHGMKPASIQQRVTRASSAVNSILTMAEEGRYAAIAIGCSGKSDKNVSEWVIGSKGKRLLDAVKKASLWIVP